MFAKILKSIDCGKTSGIYLSALGAVIAGRAFMSCVSDALSGTEQPHSMMDIDLSALLFFIAGYLLFKHNNTARKWVIGISFIGIAVTVFGLVAPLSGIQAKLLYFGAVQKASFFTTFIVILVALMIFLIPILLLYNDKARQEFNKITEVVK